MWFRKGKEGSGLQREYNLMHFNCSCALCVFPFNLKQLNTAKQLHSKYKAQSSQLRMPSNVHTNNIYRIKAQTKARLKESPLVKHYNKC